MSAGVDHAVERRQIVTGFNGMLSGTQDDCGGIGVKRLKPKPFDLLDLLRIRPRGVILVVVVQSEQPEDLINGLDALRVRRL